VNYYKERDWNVTCDSCWEPRHSHDFIKVKYDKQEVPFSRRPQEVFTEVPYIVTLSCTPITSVGEADVGVADCAKADIKLHGDLID